MIDISQVKEICKQYGIVPNKDAGQHFLLDTDVIQRSIAASGLQQNETVLEIGPGLGVLTEQLVDASHRVVAVELDPKIVELLRSKFFNVKNLELVQGDILQQDLTKLNLGAYRVIANIPYGITSRLINVLLTNKIPPKSMTLLVQKEVAERACAPAGEMSLLSLSVQLYGTASILEVVKKDAFWPAPKIDSAILQISDIQDENSLVKRLDGIDEKQFWQLAKIGYSSRRKQLQKNLSAGLRVDTQSAQDWLEQAKLDKKIRAQELTVDDWIRLAKIVEF